MIAAVRAELRKLLTVSSTYFVSGFALLLVLFVGGYAYGYREAQQLKLDPQAVMSVLLMSPEVVAGFAAIVAVLLMAHEYRYNSIMYTLVASNSRSKVLAAKLLALGLYSLVMAGLAALLMMAAVYAGANLAGSPPGPQQVYYADIAWKIGFYVWGFAMAGFVFALLMRNLVAAIVGIFIIPSTLEALLGLVLKDNVRYLPFNALDQVLSADKLSSGQAALTYLGYLSAAGLVAWILFVRRDAN